MESRMNKRTRATAPDRAQSDDKSTRQNLLETAGQIIAEKGFDRATGKEICDQARANAAAINYYFGGMEGLYQAILQEAPLKFVSVEAVTAAIADKHDAKAKLEAVIGLMVGALTAQEQEQSSWALRVMAREMIAPSPALEALRQKQMYPKARILKSIVAELMALPEDHPAVARGCLSVMAPCGFLLICDRGPLKRIFPQLGLTPDDAPALIRHMVQFTLAGLSAVAAEARGELPR
jgi:TetR/AcrR family transcriptional regulator, regulator of cefoperazone and chloramphenicol sensitivity